MRHHLHVIHRGSVQADSRTVKPACAKSSEIPISLTGREHCLCARGARDVETLGLVVREEKESVLDDRSTKGGAIHVPARFLLGKDRSVGAEAIRPVVCVQNVVTEKLPYVPMILVRAGLDRRVNNSAFEVAEFGGRVVGDEIEFLDRVRSRRIAKQVVGYLVVIHAIKQEIVCLLAIAVDQRTATISAGVIAIVEAAR